MAETTKRTTKKSTGKAGAKKAAAKKSTTTKTSGTKTAAKRSSGKKTAAKRSSGKKPAAKSSGKQAGAKKSPFGQRFLDAQRAVLLEERKKYLLSADTLRAEADALVESREPGDVQFDEESGEGDTIAVERERDLALSAHARAAVEQIDAALARIDRGTYGICVVSGQNIPKERLEAIPWAAERVEFKAGGLGRR